MKAVNHLGKTFHYGTVIATAPSDNRPGIRWTLKCKCGNIYEARGIALTCGSVKSCGCLSRERIDDLRGKRFGRWLVLSIGTPSPTGLTRWLCRCDCGTESLRHAGALKSGHTQSCGCYQAEMRSANTIHHGHCRPGKITRTYRAWQSMKNRCLNNNHRDYSYYGGRGIKICKRWMSFENFLADMGECPAAMTLERNNVDRGYEPKNCCWATRQKQSRNRRDTIVLTHNGQTKKLTEWAELLGIKAGTIHVRLSRGDSVERALRV